MPNANVPGAAGQVPAFADAGFSPARGEYSAETVSVLIVDDEPLIRWSVGQSLAARGYNVVEAGTAAEACACLSGRDDIDVVLLDLKLPDSKDLTLLRSLLRRARAPRIILMTAHGGTDVLDEALRAGAFRAITKPFDLDQMVDMVHDAAIA